MKNYCMSCGLLLEAEAGIHKKCARKIFGSAKIPDIDLSLKDVLAKAQMLAGKLSISGVQPKLSVVYFKAENSLRVVTEKGEYILKPQIELYSHIPENENLCMNIAESLGMDAPPHTLLSLKDGSKAYLIKRFDRDGILKRHTESFFQILQKKDKYNGSYEEIGKKLKSISAIPGYDVQLFFERIVINFILGNGDAHQKNFSVVYDDNNDIRLSSLYDVVCSKLLIPREEDTALTLNGKKNNLRKTDFRKLADYLGITEKARNYFLDQKTRIMEMIDHSFLNEQEKIDFKEIFQERFSRLS